jgi:uncharacterized protein
MQLIYTACVIFTVSLSAPFTHSQTSDFIETKLKAENGDAKSQARLGYMYSSGTGVEENAPEAAKWYRKSAEQGNAQAQANLGLMFSNGRGVTRNLAEARRLYHKAADQGLAEAQFKLGFMYADGEGVEIDFREAAKWIRKAAEQGFGPGQSLLGFFYLRGNGVEKSNTEAYAWFYLAADNRIASAIKARDALQVELSSAQLGDAKKRIEKLKSIVANAQRKPPAKPTN